MHPLAATQSFFDVFGSTARYIAISHEFEEKYGAMPRRILQGLMTRWAKNLLRVINVHVVHKQGTASQQPCLMVGNHISYVDIPLLMSASPAVFVAKKEVGSYPFIGMGCKRLETVLVDRNSNRSRSLVAKQVAEAIQMRGQTVAIFPSGTTTIDEQKPWRFGAFSIAKKFDIPIQPFVIDYHPLRSTAFIGDDYLAPHLWAFLRGQPVKAAIELWEPRQVRDPQTDARELHEAVKKRLNEIRTHCYN